ncbi:MAG: nucleoside recognition domain-containing protein [Prevotellamassilia sp.]
MARAAFIMDKLMHRMGLHGKSFIPMVMGFGCNVPAVMATTYDRKSAQPFDYDALVLPFMSCSARIPIYVVLISAFFPSQGAWLMLGFMHLVFWSLPWWHAFSAVSFCEATIFLCDGTSALSYSFTKSVLRHTWEKGSSICRKWVALFWCSPDYMGFELFPTFGRGFICRRSFSDCKQGTAQ